MADNYERPTIVIGLIHQDPSRNTQLNPLLDGIEEEGIPVSTRDIAEKNVIKRAYQAALSSRLSVGIAYDDQRYIVHYKNLPEGRPLFDFNINNDRQLRILGSNAARLVKGLPFKELQ